MAPRFLKLACQVYQLREVQTGRGAGMTRGLERATEAAHPEAWEEAGTMKTPLPRVAVEGEHIVWDELMFNKM